MKDQPVDPNGIDFSCYVRFVNETNETLDIQWQHAKSGYWEKEPPHNIGPKKTGECQIKDRSLAGGTDGRVTYQSTKSRLFEWPTRFECSQLGSNYISAIVQDDKLYTTTFRSGNSWDKLHDHTASGHPLCIEFVLRYKDVVDRPEVISVKASGDLLPLMQSNGTSADYSIPVWDSSRSYKDGAYSTNPLLLQCGLTRRCLEISLRVGDEVSGVKCRLEGLIGQKVVLTSGLFDSVKGVNKVLANASTDVQHPYSIVGDIEWRLWIEATGATIKLDTATRLETYWVYGKTTGNVPAPPKVRSFRKMTDEVFRQTSQVDVMRKLAENTLNGYKKEYDSLMGASYFSATWCGVKFEIDFYLELADKVQTYCNCYDQAALLQVHLAWLGFPTHWIFMRRFGGLKKSKLPGVPECNSPFFKHAETKPVVEPNDRLRTAFGNHAFVSAETLDKPEKKIFADGCAGGSTYESLKNYIDSAIDHDVTRWEKGTEKDASEEVGILKLISDRPSSGAANHDRSAEIDLLLSAFLVMDGKELRDKVVFPSVELFIGSDPNETQASLSQENGGMKGDDACRLVWHR